MIGHSVFEHGGRGHWVVQYTDPCSGRRVRRKLFGPNDPPPSRRTRKQAAARATELVRQCQESAGVTPPECDSLPTLERLFSMAVTEGRCVRTEGGPTPYARTLRRRVLGAFLEHMQRAMVRRHDGWERFGPNGLPTEVTPEHVGAFFQRYQDRGLKVKTVERQASIVRRAFSYGGELYPEIREHLQRNGNPVIVHSKATGPRTAQDVKAYSVDEARRLIAKLREGRASYVADVAEFVFETGVRPGDAYRLRATDIKLDERLVYCRTKASGHWAALTPRAAEIARQNLERSRGPLVFTNNAGTPINKDNLRRSVMSALQALGIENRRNLYGLRHAWAIRQLAEGRLAINEVSSQLGHASLKTTSIYTVTNASLYAHKLQ